MSMSTPPGWYPDPSGPSLERWWDGSAWTPHTRAAQAGTPTPAMPGTPPPGQPPTPVQPGAGPGQFGDSGQFGAPTGPAGGSPFPTADPFGSGQQPGLQHSQGFGPVQPAGGPGGGNQAKIIALSVACVVLIASIVTGVVLLNGDDEGEPDAKPKPSSTGATSEPLDSPTPTQTDDGPPPDENPGLLVDQLNGITLPVPDGWEKPDYSAEANPVMTTEDSYDCPGDGGFCHPGKVTSRTAGQSGSAKEIAEKDISKAAEEAYDHDLIDRKPFNGMTSHKKVKSGAVVVDGRSGYYVRWKVETELGPGGYAQSLAFPSKSGTEAMIVVRFAFDAGKKGPDLKLIDDITKGIKAVGDSEASGGAGSSIGPDD
ncbi:DUF2510 domain-containing protein [Streptomyces triticagri]|uniref:DUF2510 domain-containing protein n=1 Tax=Streptomyces triticagri TaxID=2293568 RepID=A0A372M651_9ACTN|nr:DUF2510 domain-containing protein [Streptomyces triticagri]RFU86418.1 DUF2510 domain-containing protein [Streptomyces triticagri]